MKPTAAAYRAARKARGLNTAQLADALGITRETVSRRENGFFPVTREHMLAISALPVKQAAKWRTRREQGLLHKHEI